LVTQFTETSNFGASPKWVTAEVKRLLKFASIEKFGIATANLIC